MTGQQQNYTPKPEDQKENPQETYKGPRKLEKARDLLDGIEGLIAKENIADSYHQSSGQ